MKHSTYLARSNVVITMIDAEICFTLLSVCVVLMLLLFLFRWQTLLPAWFVSVFITTRLCCFDLCAVWQQNVICTRKTWSARWHTNPVAVDCSLHIAILCPQTDSLHLCPEWFSVSDALPFMAHFGISTEVVCLQRRLVQHYMAGATWNCCRLSAHSAYTIRPCASLCCQFIPSHMRRVHVCLAVTCHLHFWQNDWDLSHATEHGWNG